MGCMIPALPPADLPVDLQGVAELCERLVLTAGVDPGAVRWAVGSGPAGEGWDCVLWPVGELHGTPLVLKVPRRASARPLLHQEEAVLRHLGATGGELPMAVPAVLGAADGALLLPWTPGRTAADLAGGGTAADAHRPASGRVAGDLAVMLAAVHSLAAPQVARNPVRGVPLVDRAAAFARDLSRLGADPRVTGVRSRTMRRWAQGIQAERWSGQGLLLHGDPHPGNVIVPAPGTAEDRAVLIDWGDATTGDPASDLGALLLHDPTGHALHAYREHARWDGIRRDDLWDALVARSWAWAARLALALATAYPEHEPLGACARRVLAGDAVSRPDLP